MHKLEKKNVVFTKDGARVGVKEIRAEDYADKTQRYVSLPWRKQDRFSPETLLIRPRAFVKTWNAAQDGEGGKKR